MTTPAFTPREQEVLTLLVVGRRNAEIGESLGITETTVEHHVSSLFDKAGAENRAQLVNLALSKGWVRIGKSS